MKCYGQIRLSDSQLISSEISLETDGTIQEFIDNTQEDQTHQRTPLAES